MRGKSHAWVWLFHSSQTANADSIVDLKHVKRHANYSPMGYKLVYNHIVPFVPNIVNGGARLFKVISKTYAPDWLFRL